MVGVTGQGGVVRFHDNLESSYCGVCLLSLLTFRVVDFGYGYPRLTGDV